MPRTYPEVVRVVESADKKKLTVHWRWVSPGLDTEQIGSGRAISVLAARSDAVVAVQAETTRVVEE